MAAKVTLTINFGNSFLKGAVFNHLRLATAPSSAYRSYCTKATEYDSSSDDELEYSSEEVEEVDIDSLRDVSRMNKVYHSMMDHVRDVDYVMQPRQPFQEYTAHKRRLYARFGKATGIDPAIAWPTKERLAKLIEIENKFEPTLQERWRLLAETKAAEKLEKQKK